MTPIIEIPSATPSPAETPAPAVPAEPLVDDRTRGIITKVFRLVEDVIFVGLGVLLAGCALYLLGTTAVSFVQHLSASAFDGRAVVELIEQLLLILLVVEILYTVQVSFREHTLAPEPFLLIGLIAGVRRVLVITAELAEVGKLAGDMFRNLMIELGVLTALIVALVASVMMLRMRPSPGGSASRG
jgi:uncharacterized membrane protein (DUF373 family)